MIAVYIILGVLLLISLLLIIPIKIRIIVNEDFNVYLRYTLIRVKLYPQDKKQKDTKSDDKKKAKKPSVLKQYTKRLITEKGVVEAIKEIVSIIKEAIKPFGPFFEKTSVDIKDLTVVVATPDAARTALEYGAISGIMYDLLAVVDKKFRLKRKNIRVFSNFIDQKSSINADVRFGIKPITLFPLIKSLVRVYLDRILKPQNAALNKGDVKNG